MMVKQRPKDGLIVSGVLLLREKSLFHVQESDGKADSGL